MLNYERLSDEISARIKAERENGIATCFAFDEENVSIAFYTTRERDLDEIFPWDFLDCGVTKEFLKRYIG